MSPKLREVFGVGITDPRYTYVDRDHLDAKFEHGLESNKHILIFGPSKQGKTVLWKKHIPADQHLVVRCSPQHTVNQIFEELLRGINTRVAKEFSQEFNVQSPVGAHKLGAKRTETLAPVGPTAGSSGFFLSEFKKHSKRIVIEDFHYLPETERRALAFNLKSFGDENLFFILVGIVPRHDLLTMYNGDLRGRTVEFNLQWTDAELSKCLEKGVEALNLNFDNELKTAIVSDSFHHVGLLNRIAEKICVNKGVTTSLIGKSPKLFSNEDLIESRKQLILEESTRYNPLIALLSEGFRKSQKSETVYAGLLSVCLKCGEKELLKGIHFHHLLEAVQKLDKSITGPRLDGALKRLSKLQIDRKIDPPLLYYNLDSKELRIAEPEFLFYRKHGREVSVSEKLETFQRVGEMLGAFIKGFETKSGIVLPSDKLSQTEVVTSAIDQFIGELETHSSQEQVSPQKPEDENASDTNC